MALNIRYANLPKRQRLAVLHPFTLPVGASGPTTSAWLASLPPWTILILASPLLLWPGYAMAATKFSMLDAFASLQRWIPFLLKSGFLFNIIISLFAMLFGTIAGAALGLAQISQVKTIAKLAWFITQLFRNSPWLVILFIVLLAFPFEVVIFDTVIRIPDWMKAVFGLSLPVMANISEIVRGAVMSVPTAQWESAESLGFKRRQILWSIILPQCFKRMIPPWMNWYAILTMATPLCSLLGVEEIITLSRQ
ncbi:MAG: ABC transporter permease subunit, partial [Rhodobacteraceae bacterium]|nr:ABC transporter permease subunit [Paracoccaceae bacterium]